MYNKARVEYLVKQPKSADVVEELVKLNFGLLHKQLRKFYMLDNPDALSYGYEALYNAILTFDNSKSTCFSTYATVCIYNRLGSYVRSLKTQLMLNTISYDAPVDEYGQTLLDTLESPMTADSRVLIDCGVSEVHIAIMQCLVDIKNPLKRQVIEAWILSDFKAAQSQIASKLGCTQTYVSHIISGFKFDLKNKLEVLQIDKSS